MKQILQLQHSATLQLRDDDDDDDDDDEDHGDYDDDDVGVERNMKQRDPVNSITS